MKGAYSASVTISGLILLTLTACTTNDTMNTSSTDADEDRYHEKSFSWSEAAGPLAKRNALADLSSKETTFATDAEMVNAVKAVEEKLDDKAFTDSLWKPVDYSCDELDLALWNTYGAIRVGDSTVFDEGVLRERCRLSEQLPQFDTNESNEPDLLTKSAKNSWWWEEEEVVDRQFPYKMIGRTWANFDILIYRSTGGETQFEKRRKRFGITSWWDTDASRIGVRVYQIDCSAPGAAPRECVFHHSQSNWYSNDDYVSKREPVFAGEIRNYYPDPILGWQPYSEVLYPVATARRFKISDAAISMHSVNHAGLVFRASSSAGINNSPVSAGPIAILDYVTW